jgi:Carbohydrate-binding module 48 (Isoamylase N-terminal domain)
MRNKDEGWEPELSQLAQVLRDEPVWLDQEFDGRIMARIRRTPRARLLSLRSWWLRPRAIQVSPLGLLAAGTLAVLVLVAGYLHPANVSRVTTLMSPAGRIEPGQVVQFALAAPGASQVTLVGDFNGWDARATPLQVVGAAGVWAVEVPLTQGRHEYAFVVDGREWRPDPTAPRAPANEYGPPNSVVTVGAYRL